MEKKPFVTLKQLKEIDKTYPTPYHIYDEKGIRENVRDYLGVNVDDPEDIYDLSQGYEENRDRSAPSFNYILKDVITIEE